MNVDRLAVIEMDELFLEPRSRVLTIGIGISKSTTYHARLGPLLRPDVVSPLVLWDNDMSTLRSLDLAPDLADEWQGDFEFLGGAIAEAKESGVGAGM